MKFYAVVGFYEPFILGGDVWQRHRYFVPDAKEVKLRKKIKGFVFQGGDGVFYVHEETTGFKLGEGPTEKEAIDKTNADIMITPDLRQQMEKFGPSTQWPETTLEEAERRLKRGRE